MVCYHKRVLIVVTVLPIMGAFKKTFQKLCQIKFTIDNVNVMDG